jgi:hypothetical protein
MDTTITLSELRRREVEIAPHEAVAVAQQLMCGAANIDARPPYGPPSLDSIAIAPDGSVRCLGTAATLSVPEVAIILQALLATSVSRVPGGLRYAVGRALLEVEAPPFDSLEEFSIALERFERGTRSEAVAQLFQRGALAGVPATTGDVHARPHRERRLHGPSVAELRRDLREMDLRLFEARQDPHADRRSINRSGGFSRRAPMAACMVAGAALLAAGELVQTHRVTHAPPARVDAAVAPASTTIVPNDIHPIAAAATADDAREKTESSPITTPGAIAPSPAAAPHAVAVAHTHRRPTRTTARKSASRVARADANRQPATTRHDGRQELGSHRRDDRRVDRDRDRDRGVIARIRFEWDNPFK